MKIIEVRRESQRFQGVDFLRREGSRNLYLFERMAAASRSGSTYLFLSGGEVFGAAQSRSGVHFHLFFSDRAPERGVGGAKDFLLDCFPELETLFGDMASVERFVRAWGRGPVTRKVFLFMELERGGFMTRGRSGAEPGRPGDAESLFPLQAGYEVEELGVDISAIDRRRTLESLRRRLERGEVTVLREGGRVVACAGVNARFEGTCQVGSVFVPPPSRGKGYGESVVSAHVERLFERYARVVLFVGEGNAPARRIYEKLGFRRTGELLYAAFEAGSPHARRAGESRRGPAT